MEEMRQSGTGPLYLPLSTYYLRGPSTQGAIGVGAPPVIREKPLIAISVPRVQSNSEMRRFSPHSNAVAI
jgi:hypothetical protein